jgi:hypothetical protein
MPIVYTLGKMKKIKDLYFRFRDYLRKIVIEEAEIMDRFYAGYA